MQPKSIPDSGKDEVQRRIDRFNTYDIPGSRATYAPRFRGRYLYLHRDDGRGPRPLCRLTYTGDMENWEFAIYKYSSERYSSDEWFFPGQEEVDGTVEGAMLAGMLAYP